MPDWHGFRLAEMIYVSNPQTQLIFVSIHENLVFDSQEYMPLGFARKRLLEQDIFRIMKLYFRTINSIRITYKVKDGFSRRDLVLRDILYVECNGHDLTYVMIQDNLSYHSTGSLKTLENELMQYHFIRIHKNYLVNQRYVADIEKRSVLLTNGIRIDMGRDRRKVITEAMLRYRKEHHGN